MNRNDEPQMPATDRNSAQSRAVNVPWFAAVVGVKNLRSSSLPASAFGACTVPSFAVDTRVNLATDPIASLASFGRDDLGAVTAVRAAAGRRAEPAASATRRGGATAG